MRPVVSGKYACCELPAIQNAETFSLGDSVRTWEVANDIEMHRSNNLVVGD